MGAFKKFLLWFLVVLILLGGVGVIGYFTNGFTSDFKTFYLSVDGKDVLTTASGYVVSKDSPLKVDVKYTLGGDETQGYSIKIVPNQLPNTDFDFILDGEPYSYHAEKDLTAGFDIVQEEDSFTVTPKGKLSDILSAVYPEHTIDKCNQETYKDMFLLVVTSYNGESTVTIAFTVPIETTGVTVSPAEIEF